MSPQSIRPVLTTLHRWTGLILAPLFLIVILSGAVLAFRPIVGSFTEPSTAPSVEAKALGPLVDRLSGLAEVSAVAIADAGRAVDVTASDPQVSGRWVVATGERLGAVPGGGVDVFGVAEKIHKQLLVGLGLVVEAAAWVMVALVLIGPFLGWLRLRNTLLGWHAAVGWFLFPLVLALPLTGVLMTLHVGEGANPLPRAARPVTVAEALTIAAPTVDLTGLVEARRFRGGTVLLRTASPAPAIWVVTDTAARRLEGGPSLVKQIHEGTWGGLWSGLLNFVGSLALGSLTLTGVWSWVARRRRERPIVIDASAEVLVAHASQTGTATRFAEATAAVLSAGGEKVAVAPLGTLDPTTLARYRQVLVLVSSTGDGALPDTARGFVETLEPDGLAGVRVAVFGLGDRSYPHFCGGAERLRSALRLAGAQETLPPVFADGDPTAAWKTWLGELDLRLGLALGGVTEAATREPRVDLKLVDRRRLDDPTRGETQETWALTFESPRDLVFRPGDLLRIVPVEGARERTYSIGTSSRVDPRHIVLTVVLASWRDEAGATGFGLASEALTRSLPLGSTIAARITPHPSFNPPEDPSRPVLMVAAGSGVAPFVGFPQERLASGKAGPAWLVFGNRTEGADFLWQTRFETALASGGLTRLDTAFSPRAGVGVRVQERLAAMGAEVCRWLTERDALLYVCGRRAMVDGVLAAVADILTRYAGFTAAAAKREVDRRIASGRIRIDAFG